MLGSARALRALLFLAILVSCSSPAPAASPQSSSPAGGTPTGSTGPGASLPLGASIDPTVDPTQGPPPTDRPSPSPTPEPTDPGQALDAALAKDLQRVVNRFQKRVQIPGMSVAVLLHGGGFWAGVAGDRRVTTDAPVDPRTVFAIASITKTFVAAAVMKLVAEGQLSLDDHLSTWVPSVPYAKKITIAQLLGHTSGVYNHFENADYNRLVWGDTKHRWTFDEILDLIAKSYCKPGACYHYSNTNFVILGHIVELVTGQSLADAIQADLTSPLGLVDTLLQPEDATPVDHANAYSGGQDWTRNSKVIPTMSGATVAAGAGAMVSTASDLAHWADALYTGGVVPEAQLDQMLEFKACHDNYGLGTRKLIINGRVAYGHLGSLRGYTDAMLYFPREGATIVVLSNRGFWNVQAAVQQIGNVLWPAIGAPSPQFDPHKNTTNHDGVTLYC